MALGNKHVFWEALLVTVIVFGIGIFLGVLLENWRTNKIDVLYQQSEIKLLDMRAQSEIYSLEDFDCKTAIEENLNFANRIYDEAQLLEKYEDAGRLTDALKAEHKKYDVLRSLLWVNSIKLKKKCKASYHNVVYIYDYNDPSIATKAEQSVFSRVLTELKQKQGDNVMLIPIAGDNDLSSVSVLMNLYNVTEKELPIILIDEKIKVPNLEKVEQIEKLLS